MTEITYTNKDGLTPAEGTKSLDWTNRNGVSDSPFNYHQDGAAEGDGYAHGGYPEITGESSPYTDTSYKTGDNPDFFDNGNVWEQEQPEPEPTTGYTVTLKPVVTTQGTIEASSVITDGTFVQFTVGDTYTIICDGVPYENQVVKLYEESERTKYLGLGNSDAFFLRGGEAMFSMLQQMVDSDEPPFALINDYFNGEPTADIIPMFIGTTSTEHVVTIIRNSDSASYTLTFTSEGPLLLFPLSLFAPKSEDYWASFAEEYGIENGNRAKMILNDEEFNGTWMEVTQQGRSIGTWFIPDGYDPPESLSDLESLTYPATIIYGDLACGILFATVINASRINTLTLLKGTTDSGNDDSGSDDDAGKSLTISGTFVNDETVKGPAVSDEDFAILVDNDCKLVNVNYNGTVHKATVSYSESDGGIIDFYFDIDDNMGTYLWICAEDGSEDTTRYLQAAKESGTVGEEEFTISIDIENFTEEGGAGGTDPGR